MDDETFLRICRETGRTGDLVDRLLALGRVAEAMAATEDADDHTLLRLADIFVRHAHGATAEAIVRERGAKTGDVRVLDWLKARHEACGDAAGVLDIVVRAFRMQPTLGRYQEARALAIRRDRWEPLRPKLRMFLREAKHDHLLLQIYLDEGEINNALRALKEPRSAGYGYGYGHDIELAVAARAEEMHPHAAVDIYQARAARLIEGRSRPSYREAAALLARVKAIYERIDQGERWQGYIKELRARYSSLRALKEELTAAGL